MSRLHVDDVDHVDRLLGYRRQGGPQRERTAKKVYILYKVYLRTSGIAS